MDFENIPDDFRIAIIGSGAIGSYYGARLASSGRDVHFLLRSDLDHVRENGISVTSIHGDFQLSPDQAGFHATTEEIGPCDLVIIALKTTSNHLLPDLLAPLVKENTLILTLQNGLGSDEFLASHFDPERILGGLCFVCINRTSPGVIDHTSQGLISIGEFSGSRLARTDELCELFKAANIPCRVTDSLAAERWRKLVWNVPFNGLSIVGGSITTDLILADPDLTTLARGLMREVVDSARALGHDLPDSIIDENINKTAPMKSYRPSSLIDYMEGREVEVEAIWGEPYRRGLDSGAQVGRLEAVYRLISALTSRVSR